ncbi:hypothetical protein [Deinococcus hohokamensis]|uniref:5-bromo-4-chloroindolyl phosphate hydrolysis protein n=1 Tax=Deinococcus hohokamensis TaxID=309883 RepID=A0ABV9I741_9DEIO
MAPRVSSGVKVARVRAAARASGRAASVGVRAAHQGLRVMGRLSRAASSGLRTAAPDPWLTSGGGRARAGALTRRAGGLLRLVLGGLLVAAVLSALGLVLLVFALQGSALAAWLLAATFLIALLGLVWGARRAARLVRPPVAPQGRPASPAEDEAGLLHTLRTHQRALPPGGRDAFQGAVLATRDALRLTAGDATLGRDAFDARQAAREDLPEVLRVYRAAPRTPEAEQELQEQLGLIERRMRQVIQTRTEAQGRALQANRRYLEDKYAAPEPDPEGRA